MELFREKLKHLKAVVFDGDGVFFSGRVFISQEKGEILKERSYVDGQGISFLRALGIEIALVSGEKSSFLGKIAEKLNLLPSVKEGKWSKISVFEGPQGEQKIEVIGHWLSQRNIEWQECAAMGDDISDFSLLKRVGVAVVPCQAEAFVKQIAHYITPREGGKGAIRDFCNLILEAKERDVTSLPLR